MWDSLSVWRAAYTNVTPYRRRGRAPSLLSPKFLPDSGNTLLESFARCAWRGNRSHPLKGAILELSSPIYLCQRAHGFAAREIYFGKPLKDVSIAQAAMLAGLPKAPSSYNPVSNPKRAKLRQHYVLRRMHELRYIDDASLAEAQNAPLIVRQGLREILPVHAQFAAEMARQVVFEASGGAYTKAHVGPR